MAEESYWRKFYSNARNAASTGGDAVAGGQGNDTALGPGDYNPGGNNQGSAMIDRISSGELSNSYKNMYAEAEKARQSVQDTAARRTQEQNARNIAHAQNAAAQGAALSSYNPQMAARLQDYKMSSAYGANQQANAALNDQANQNAITLADYKTDLMRQQRQDDINYMQNQYDLGRTTYADYINRILMGEDVSGTDMSTIYNPDGTFKLNEAQQALIDDDQRLIENKNLVNEARQSIKNKTPIPAGQLRRAIDNDTSDALVSDIYDMAVKNGTTTIQNVISKPVGSIIMVNGRPMMITQKGLPYISKDNYARIRYSGVYMDKAGGDSGELIARN